MLALGKRTGVAHDGEAPEKESGDAIPVLKDVGA